MKKILIIIVLFCHLMAFGVVKQTVQVIYTDTVHGRQDTIWLVADHIYYNGIVVNLIKIDSAVHADTAFYYTETDPIYSISVASEISAFDTNYYKLGGDSAHWHPNKQLLNEITAQDTTNWGLSGNGNVLSSVPQNLNTQTENGILVMRGDSIYSTDSVNWENGGLNITGNIDVSDSAKIGDAYITNNALGALQLHGDGSYAYINVGDNDGSDDVMITTEDGTAITLYDGSLKQQYGFYEGQMAAYNYFSIVQIPMDTILKFTSSGTRVFNNLTVDGHTKLGNSSEDSTYITGDLYVDGNTINLKHTQITYDDWTTYFNNPDNVAFDFNNAQLQIEGGTGGQFLARAGNHYYNFMQLLESDSSFNLRAKHSEIYNQNGFSQILNPNDEFIVGFRSGGDTSLIITDDTMFIYVVPKFENINEDTSNIKLGLTDNNEFVKNVQVYAGMYLDSNNVTTTINTMDVWEKVGNFTQSSIFENATYTQDTLWIDYDGIYEINTCVSGYNSVGAQDYEIGISINGNEPLTESRGFSEFSPASAMNAISNFRTRLSIGDYIVLKVRDITDTRDVTLIYGNVYIKKLN